MKRSRVFVALLAAFCLFDLALAAYQIPSLHDRVDWRLQEWQRQIRDVVMPHPETIATPNPTLAAMVQATLTAMAHSPTPSTAPLESPLPSVTPTALPSHPPLPPRMELAFTRYEYQGMNNCSPASLSMMLRYWGWNDNQYTAAAYLKPNQDDKNVMAYEMERFVKEETSFSVILRTGGTLDDLRSLIAAGFPPVVEKGFNVIERNRGWMGHSLFLTGYDDATRKFLAQDSFQGQDTHYDYDDLFYDWRAFNFTYLVAYPPERESEVLAVLGPNADPTYNLEQSFALAQRETTALQDHQSLAFAFFNLGTNYVAMKDYSSAALAFDQARYLLLPWRFLWYQTGPYFAYYYSGRYQEVLNLAQETLNAEEMLEESWYWRGMARMALGDRDGAISDWREALIKHPGFSPALYQLQQAGETP